MSRNRPDPNKIKPTDPAPHTPTVRDIEALFNDLIVSKYSIEDEIRDHPDYLEHQFRVDRRKEELKEDHTLVRFEKELEITRSKLRASLFERIRRATAVQRMYRANGYTPEVAKALAKLVNDVNTGKL